MNSCLDPISLILFLTKASSQCQWMLDSVISIPGFSLEYFKTFFLTVLFESVFYVLGLKYRRRFSTFQALIILLCANMATHPLIYFLFPRIFASSWTYGAYLAVAEIFAVSVESLILKFAGKLSFSRAFLTSLLANGFSWWLGVILLYSA